MGMKGLIWRSGEWQYDFIFKGRRHTGTTGHRNPKSTKLAQEFLNDMKAKLREEERLEKLGHRKDPDILTEDLFKEWCQNHQGPNLSRVSRDWHLHILPVLGKVKAMEVTTGLTESIRTKYLSEPSKRNAHFGKATGKPRSNRTANKLMTHLRLVFGWAFKTDRIPRMPFKKLAELKTQDPVRTFLMPDQVDQFLERLDATSNLHLRVAVRAMLWLALREDEALHLRWAGFNADFSIYQTWDTKTGTNVPLPVPVPLRELMKELRQGVPAGCEWCLPQTEATGLTKKGTPKKAKKGTPGLPHEGQYTRKAIERAGGKDIIGLSPHRMRGSCVTLMARKGANAFVIKKMGRWKRIETALNYVEIIEADLVEAQQKAFNF